MRRSVSSKMMMRPLWTTAGSHKAKRIQLGQAQAPKAQKSTLNKELGWGTQPPEPVGKFSSQCLQILLSTSCNVGPRRAVERWMFDNDIQGDRWTHRRGLLVLPPTRGMGLRVGDFRNLFRELTKTCQSQLFQWAESKPQANHVNICGTMWIGIRNLFSL